MRSNEEREGEKRGSAIRSGLVGFRRISFRVNKFSLRRDMEVGLVLW